MDNLAVTLLTFVLGCLIHLEWEVASVKTIVKRNNNNSQVDNEKPKGRKKLKGE